jgi:vacuolar protein sorting-associated protein IST1
MALLTRLSFRFSCGTSACFSQEHEISDLRAKYRLSVQRLRTLQEKKEAQAKVARRDIATLLERGKVETARIKVESSTSIFPRCRSLSLTRLFFFHVVINEDIYLELLELLELYCELLIARFGLVELK